MKIHRIFLVITFCSLGLIGSTLGDSNVFYNAELIITFRSDESFKEFTSVESAIGYTNLLPRVIGLCDPDPKDGDTPEVKVFLWKYAKTRLLTLIVVSQDPVLSCHVANTWGAVVLNRIIGDKGTSAYIFQGAIIPMGPMKKNALRPLKGVEFIDIYPVRKE